jgi:hypothetical protein
MLQRHTMARRGRRRESDRMVSSLPTVMGLHVHVKDLHLGIRIVPEDQRPTSDTHQF